MQTFLRRCVLATFLVLLASPVFGQSRGRDPWVFRLIMEEKTGILVCALSSNLWVAYNTANGGVYRVWSGGMQFKGKVYDFGQGCSLAIGTTYHLQNNDVLRALDETVSPAGWTKAGTITNGTSWTFGSTNATFTSPAMDLSQYDHVMLHFEESGGTNWPGVPGGGAFKVQVSTNDGATWNAQEFYSGSRKGASPQEQYKLIDSHAPQVRARFISGTGQMRNIRVQGDYRVWSARQGDSPVPTSVEWRGHRLQGRTAGVTLKYDVLLPASQRVAVEETPEIAPGAASPPGLHRRFSATGVPVGTVLSLKLSRAEGAGAESWQIVEGAGTLRSAGGNTFLDLAADGVTTIRGTW